MDMRIPPLTSKILLESNPLKSKVLVRRLAAHMDVMSVVPPKLARATWQPRNAVPCRSALTAPRISYKL